MSSWAESCPRVTSRLSPTLSPRSDELPDPAFDLRQRHSRLAAGSRFASAVDDGEGPADAGHSEPQSLEGAGDAVGLGRLLACHQCLLAACFSAAAVASWKALTNSLRVNSGKRRATAASSWLPVVPATISRAISVVIGVISRLFVIAACPPSRS